MENMSDALKVRQFTEESSGKVCPTVPKVMKREAVEFIMKMVFSEMGEMAQTVCNSTEETFKLMHDCIGHDFNLNYDYEKPKKDVDVIAEQNDAMVDAWYYMLNCAAKHGVNLSSIFDVVHEANMAKKWNDGKFHRRDDGKVIKPDDWKEPDIKGEIIRQLHDETF
jgi:predicted HAD superfamily Cof-like phosphohydrolase